MGSIFKGTTLAHSLFDYLTSPEADSPSLLWSAIRCLRWTYRLYAQNETIPMKTTINAITTPRTIASVLSDPED